MKTNYNIRAGIISSIDYERGMVRVLIPDQDDAITPLLPLLSAEYNMPNVKDAVYCIFLGNGVESGLCLGKYFSDKNVPNLTGATTYEKVVLDEFTTSYDSGTKTLIITADNIVLNGNVRVNGNLDVDGNIVASGTITPSTPV